MLNLISSSFEARRALAIAMCVLITVLSGAVLWNLPANTSWDLGAFEAVTYVMIASVGLLGLLVPKNTILARWLQPQS